VTQRTHIRQATNIAKYDLAKIYAQALLENLMTPQRYYDFENLGRVDIPIGYKFSFEGVEVLMREENHEMSKDTGWIIKGKAFEAT
jgi:hypothetical protein